MRILFYSFLFITFNFTQFLSAQSNIWETLSQVTIKTKWDESHRYQFDYPIFSELVKSLEGKEITVKGYIIPLEEMQGQKFFILSALPFNLCYFCGGAGPETVMEVNTTKEIAYTSKPVTLRGNIKLNDNDFNHLMYILNNAILVEN